MNTQYTLFASFKKATRPAALLVTALSTISLAEPQPVPVRKVQGTSHAFLVLRAESGAVLG